MKSSEKTEEVISDSTEENIQEMDESVEEIENVDVEPAQDDAEESASEENGEVIDDSTDQAIEELKAKASDFEDKYKRLAAEFENYKRRNKQELQSMLRFSNQSLVKGLLPSLDNLQRAISSATQEEENEVDQELIKGIQMVESQIVGVLEKHNVKKMTSLGEKFDPNLHEAIGMVETDEVQDNHVANVMQEGYELFDRVIRPSMVQVAKNKS